MLFRSGFQNSAVHDAAKRVTLVEEDEFGLTGRQAIVEIDTKDGRHLSLRSEEPRGEPTNPLTEDELQRKFNGLAAMVIRDEKLIDSISQRVMSLEKESNASFLSSLTVAANGKPELLTA